MHSLTLTSIFVCVRARKRSLVWNGQSHASKRTHADHFVFVWPNKKNFMQISVIDNFSWQRANHSILLFANRTCKFVYDFFSRFTFVLFTCKNTEKHIENTGASDPSPRFFELKKPIWAILCRFNFKPENKDVKIL